LVQHGRVVVFGAAGVAHAVDEQSGEALWTRDLYDEFGGQEGYFGAGSTPVAVGPNVLFNVGGKPQAGLVALSLDDGQTVWQATDEGASYASPAQCRLSGQTRVVFVTRLNLLMVDPADGAVLLRLPFGKRGPTVNAATPLVFDDQLFVTASYGVGARLLALADREARPIWSGDETLSSQYNTPILHEGFLYGIHGREDVGQAELRCVEASTGKVAWSRPNFGVAHLLLADNKLLLLTSDGRLILARPSPASYQELARTTISSGTTRALPAISQGRLLLRDNQADVGQLICLLLPGR
jgi:outer membrane protein assembly factor BamB